MCLVQIIGYLACTLVFATFYMQSMLPLRLVAIASNLAFIAYGYLGGLAPILLLHLVLLPLNGWRLRQAMRLAGNACPVRSAGSSLRFLRRRQAPRRHWRLRRQRQGRAVSHGMPADLAGASVAVRWV